MAKEEKILLKNGGTEIVFTDTSKDVKKAIEKLSKDALGASAKIIRKKLRENVPLRSKRFKNHIASWKYIDSKTGQPTLQIGFYSWQRVRKKGKLASHASPWWIEFGTKPHIITPKQARVMYYETSFGKIVHHPGQKELHILRDTIQNNIGEIKAAQEEYLKKISDTLDAADIKYDNTPDEETD